VAENTFQRKLIRELEKRFPGCMVIKNDSGYRQGILDLTIFYGDKWASLEVKDSVNSRIQPNQEYYVRRLNDMSFAAFIYPENKAEVLDALQQAFETSGRTCVP
jgi:hypothetical protein